MLHYFVIALYYCYNCYTLLHDALLILHYLNVSLLLHHLVLYYVNVALFYVAPMLKYFDVALFDVALFDAALFTGALLNVVLY